MGAELAKTVLDTLPRILVFVMHRLVAAFPDHKRKPERRRRQEPNLRGVVMAMILSGYALLGSLEDRPTESLKGGVLVGQLPLKLCNVKLEAGCALLELAGRA